MSEPYVGEIRIVGFDYAPRGWALCDGQLVPINQNAVLYSMLLDTFGGDRAYFALPDLRGRVPMHFGSGAGGHHAWGSHGGRETVPLEAAEMPEHSHPLQGATAAGDASSPQGSVLAEAATPIYGGADSLVPMESTAVMAAGAGRAHDNMQPSLALNFCIALSGVMTASA